MKTYKKITDEAGNPAIEITQTVTRVSKKIISIEQLESDKAEIETAINTK